jgi:hypothetical protein
MPDRLENARGLEAMEQRILARFLDNAASRGVSREVVDRIRLLIEQGRVASVEELLAIVSEPPSSSNASD